MTPWRIRAKAGDNADLAGMACQVPGGLAQLAGIERRPRPAKARQAPPGGIAVHDFLERPPVDALDFGGDPPQLLVGKRRTHADGLARRDKFVKMAAVQRG